MPSARFIFMSLAAVALLAVGCGSSADGEGNTTEEEAVTKAAFIKQADAICEQTDKTQKTEQRAFEKKYPEADSSDPWQEKIVVEVGLPPVQTMAEELSELSVPSGDEEEIEAIVDGLEQGVDEAQANPSSMLKKGSAGPFTEVFKLTKEYGFKACATPI